jgi:hypothetical protein
MYRTATRWSAYAWIAIMAILFNVLAPVLSHARANAGAAAAQVEICTAMGVTMVAIPADQPDPGQLAKGMNHCAYCATHAGSFGLPPQSVTLFAVLGGHDAYPSLFFQSPYPLPVWSVAQARAPPAAS